MNIIYRITSRKQWNPGPVYGEDKWKMVQLCHNSFLKAKTDEPVTYILDSCSPEWVNFFAQYGQIVIRDSGQYDVLSSVQHMFKYAKNMEGKILMVEDDYLWRPNTIKDIWRGLDEFKMVSPYDHPTHYLESRYSDFQFKLKLIDNIVWRNGPSNTHTFATTGEYIRDHWEQFNERNYDDIFFRSLPDQIWMPVGNSFATHMATGFLAPDINWSELYVDK